MNKPCCAMISLLVLCLLASPLSAQKTETLEKSFAVDAGQPVFFEFEEVDGNLFLFSSPDNAIHVKVKKETKIRDEKKAERLLRETRVDISHRGNFLKVRIVYPRVRAVFLRLRDYQRVKVTSEIWLPPNSRMNGTLVDGSVTGENIEGEMNLKTVDGSIVMSDVRGTIRARTTDGRVTLRNVHGESEVRTTDGRITVSGIFSRLNLQTVDGNINAVILSPSRMEADWKFSTVDGSVDISLPPDFPADIHLRTSDGRIDCRIPLTSTKILSRNQISGKINNGGHLLTIRTVDGKIILRGEPGNHGE